MTFGVADLLDGVELTVVLVSVFAIGEILYVASRYAHAPDDIIAIKGKAFMTREDWRRSWKPWLRGTAIGFPIGTLPGGGSEIPTMLSYTLEKKLARHKDEFGKGAIEGVAGPEAANNASAAVLLAGCGTLSSVSREGKTDEPVFPDPEKVSLSSGTFPNLSNLAQVQE